MNTHKKLRHLPTLQFHLQFSEIQRRAVCAHFDGVDINNAGVVRPDAIAAVKAFTCVKPCVLRIARDKLCKCVIVYVGVDVVFIAVDVYLRGCGLA